MIVVPIITILTKGYGNGRSWSKILESSVDISVLDLNVMNRMPSVSLHSQNLPRSPIALVCDVYNIPGLSTTLRENYGVMENIFERDSCKNCFLLLLFTV